MSASGVPCDVLLSSLFLIVLSFTVPPAPSSASFFYYHEVQALSSMCFYLNKPRVGAGNHFQVLQVEEGKLALPLLASG